MTLQTSGTISINDLKAEFGSTSNRLRDYYRGGSIVPNSPVNSGVPTSGTISLFDFYGAQALEPLSYSLDGDPTPTVYKAGNSTYPVSATTSTIRITAVGGLAPFTITATKTGGSGGFELNTPATGANYKTFSWYKQYGEDNTDYTENWQLKIVDAAGQQATFATTVFVHIT